MTISSKIKALLNITNKEHSQLAEYLGISRQALSNKFYRGSFSSSDLIKIANFTECSLSFIVDENQRITLNSIDTKEIDALSEKKKQEMEEMERIIRENKYR